jgi:cyclic beta-1,2-glucan synthetase
MLPFGRTLVRRLRLRDVSKDLAVLETLMKRPLGRDFLVHSHPTRNLPGWTAQWRAQLVLKAIGETRRQMFDLIMERGSRNLTNDLRRPYATAQTLSARRPTGFSTIDWAAVLSDCNPGLRSEEISVAHFAIRAYLLTVLTEEVTLWILNLTMCNPVHHASLLLQLESALAISSNELSRQLIHVDDILANDPACAYDNMDDRSKEEYRYAVRRESVNTSQTDSIVARAAIEEASKQPDKKQKHVGIHLGMTCSAWHSVSPGYQFYWIVGVLAGLGVLAARGLLQYTAAWKCIAVGMGLVAINVASAVETLGIFVLLRRPRPKPLRMDVSRNRIKVATIVPALLTSESQVDALLNTAKLNMRADGCGAYVFLTDFCDSDINEPTAVERYLLKKIVEAVRDQNARGSTCVLLHRNRTFDRGEGLWIGWERKRGKIEQFNDFVLNGAPHFSLMEGPVTLIRDAEWALVIDEDTLILANSVGSMLGAALHPLNAPAASCTSGIVEDGYGIWTSHPRAVSDPYAEWFKSSGQLGPVRDFFYELLGQGRSSGKGLYHIRTFHTVLHARLPLNSILSHDAIEGAVLRCGYCEDPVFVEKSIANYYARCSRAHRWTRGDWQNLALYFMPKLRRPNSVRQILRASPIGDFVVVLQLARIATPVALFIVLASCVYADEATAGVTLAITVSILMYPGLIGSLAASRLNYHMSRLGPNLMRDARALFDRLVTILLRIVVAPLAAAVQLGAILWSTISLIRARGLIQWTPSSNTSGHSHWRLVHWGSASVSLVFFVVVRARGVGGMIGHCLLILWAAAPLVADTGVFCRLLHPRE